MTNGEAKTVSLLIVIFIVFGTGGYAIYYRVRKNRKLKERLEQEELEARIRSNTLQTEPLIVTPISIQDEDKK